MIRTLIVIPLAAAAAAGAQTAADISVPKGLEATIWVNNPKPGQLPPGVSHHTYYSESMKRDAGYCLYLPPDYAAASTRYPALVMPNGGRMTHYKDSYDGKYMDETT